MSYDLMVCSECGDGFDPDRALYWVHDRESDEWLCANCTKTYNRLAGEMMIKSFEALPNLYRLALSDTRLSGIEALNEKIEETSNDD